VFLVFDVSVAPTEGIPYTPRPETRVSGQPISLSHISTQFLARPLDRDCARAALRFARLPPTSPRSGLNVGPESNGRFEPGGVVTRVQVGVLARNPAF
jgi:hypothetical protein